MEERPPEAEEAVRALEARAASALGPERAQDLRPLLARTAPALAHLWHHLPDREEEPLFFPL